ncbi:hypothetical protein NLJ89_g12110 [Agrocybe chaxingu]|uniref:Uncharacterized protein n=1 Tax=Agrocybe chaxingu TaxID=84603 RepID=A0A9W8JNV8_9AGAR|nr:hypothetical protein NLJ89_g12110 [Agrocybe chaxingu]
MVRPPPQRSSRPSADPSADVPRWDSSLGRSSSRSVSGNAARSPPKAMPEVWTPTVTQAEDAAASKQPYSNLGRRGSTASMRSTGSGASIRPSITETIPERVDDVAEDTSSSNDRERERKHDQDKAKKLADKARDKEKRRRSSRPTPVDPSIYDDPPLGSSGPRPSGSSSATMQYATSPPPVQPLSSKASFPDGDERYHPSDRGKPIPYLDPRDQHPPGRDIPYSHREPPYSAPLSRPPPPRSPYGENDRDYPPYPPMNRPPIPKPPFPGDRDYHPPMVHKSSFTYEDRRRTDWERNAAWEGDRWEGDREPSYRDWGYRERDRDRDRGYADARYPGPSPYSARSGYPTPPSSAQRHASHDYLPMNDLWDEADNVPPPPRGYDRYRGHPPDDWSYDRPDNARPLPSRQPSYREDPERRMAPDIGWSSFLIYFSRLISSPHLDVFNRAVSWSCIRPSSSV